MKQPSDDSDLVRRRNAAKQLDVSQAQLVKWERAGILTPVTVAGLRVTWYRARDVRALAVNIAEHGVLSTQPIEA